MHLYNASSSYYSMIARLALNEAGVVFNDRRLDIHFKKEQLSTWYRMLNPKMTVPSLVDGSTVYRDSHDILDYAKSRASRDWLDSESSFKNIISTLENEFYAIQIEKITFSKAMLSIPPLHYVFPHLLEKIIKQLERELATSTDPNAITEKIKINQARIDFFTKGDLREKFNHELHSALNFLSHLPNPGPLIMGEKISSIDILTATLLTRIHMIKEYNLITNYPHIDAWFQNFQNRESYKKSDMWLRFHPMRILLGI